MTTTKKAARRKPAYYNWRPSCPMSARPAGMDCPKTPTEVLRRPPNNLLWQEDYQVITVTAHVVVHRPEDVYHSPIIPTILRWSATQHRTTTLAIQWNVT